MRRARGKITLVVSLGCLLGSVAVLALREPRGRSPASGTSPAGAPELYREYPDLSQGVDADGNPVAEVEQFKALGRKLNAIQDRLKETHGTPQLVRGFHAKSIGCLKGELRLDPARAEETRFGIFRETRSWPVWVRFSDGVGFMQADRQADVRGMAIKVMGVPGPKLLPDEQFTQDFLMTNGPRPLGGNAAEFMEFAEAASLGNLALAQFALFHPTIAGILLTHVSRRIESMQTERYWSGSPYHLGNPGELARAIKFTVLPSRSNKDAAAAAPRSDDEYLRKRLQDFGRQHEIVYDFSIQIQKDPVAQPIENTLVDWEDHDAALVNVGSIHLPPQEFDSEAQLRFCDDLVFNPWHSLAEHRPLGNMNRARKIVYDMSARHRAVMSPGGTRHEPEAK